MLVIQPGSIVLLAFVMGDYATQLLPLGAYSSSFYAVAAIALFTGLNLLGIRQGKGVQNALAIAELLGLLLIIGVGLVWTPSSTAAISVEPAASNWGSILTLYCSLTAAGMKRLTFLLSYGGLSATWCDRCSGALGLLAPFTSCSIWLIYTAWG